MTLSDHPTPQLRIDVSTSGGFFLEGLCFLKRSENHVVLDLLHFLDDIYDLLPRIGATNTLQLSLGLRRSGQQS